MKALIEKYFDGETSLEEEAKLRDFFTNGQAVPEELKVYQPLFQHLTDERGQVLSADFDEKLFQKMDVAEGEVVRLRTWPKQLLRIAAVGGVLVVAFLFLQKFNKPAVEQQATIDWSKYEIKDEKLAYEETVKALKLVSSKLNKGSKKAAKEVGKMEKVGKYFN